MALKKVKRDTPLTKEQVEEKLKEQARLNNKYKEIEEEEVAKASEDEEKIDRKTGKDGKIPIVSIENAQAAKAKAKSGSARNKQSSSSFKIINTSKSGKRIVIKEDIIQYLDETEKIEVAFTVDAVVLGASGVGISEIPYSLRKDKKNYNLYNSALVEEITERFSLDFTKTTTVGLEVTKAKTLDGRKIIQIKKD